MNAEGQTSGQSASPNDSATSCAPLRIGALVDDQSIRASWIRRLLGEIANDETLQLAGLLTSRGRSQNGGGLFSLITKAEGALASRSTGKAPSPEIHDGLDEKPWIDAEDRDAVMSLELDVIIDLAGGYGEACAPDLARHGVWFVDVMAEDAAFASCRSVARKDPIGSFAVFRRTADSESLQCIAGGSVNPKFIASRHLHFMREKSVGLLLRELRNAQRNAVITREEGLKLEKPQPPNATTLMKYAGGVAQELSARLTGRVRSKLGCRPGMFYLRTSQEDLLSFDPAASLKHFPDDNAYYADPFLWEREGELFCFFEAFDYASGVGHIRAGKLENGRLVDTRIVLKADYHLSYPFLFEHQGALYMMPETCGARRIELWRCARFPDTWEFHSIVLDDIIAADTSIACIRGEWWMFTNVSTDPYNEMNSELHLYRIDGPDFRKIEPHPGNPVVFDTRVARGAGRIIEHGGAYYRPSQNNSHGVYGYGLNLMRIDEISMSNYAETLVRSITPDFEAGLMGCHHLDMRAGAVIFDVRQKGAGR